MTHWWKAVASTEPVGAIVRGSKCTPSLVGAVLLLGRSEHNERFDEGMPLNEINMLLGALRVDSSSIASRARGSHTDANVGEIQRLVKYHTLPNLRPTAQATLRHPAIQAAPGSAHQRLDLSSCGMSARSPSRPTDPGGGTAVAATRGEVGVALGPGGVATTGSSQDTSKTTTSPAQTDPGTASTGPPPADAEKPTRTEDTRTDTGPSAWSVDGAARLRASLAGAASAKQPNAGGPPPTNPSISGLEGPYAANYVCAMRPANLIPDGYQRPMSDLEHQTTLLWSTGKIFLSKVPNFFMETFTTDEYAALADYHKKHLLYRLYIRLPRGFMLPNYDANRQFWSLLQKGAQLSGNPRSPEYVDALFADHHTTTCEARFQMVTLTFLTPALRNKWRNRVFSFMSRKVKIVLKASDTLSAKEPTIGLDEGARQLQYSILLLGLQSRTQQEVLAIARAMDGQPPIMVEEIPPIGDAFAPHFWRLTYDSLSCPPELVHVRRLKIRQEDTTYVAHVHHHLSTFRYPCGECLSVTHSTKDCNTTDKETAAAQWTLNVSITPTSPSLIGSRIRHDKDLRDRLLHLRAALAPAVLMRLEATAQTRAETGARTDNKPKKPAQASTGDKQETQSPRSPTRPLTAAERKAINDKARSAVEAMASAKHQRHEAQERVVKDLKRAGKTRGGTLAGKPRTPTEAAQRRQEGQREAAEPGGQTTDTDATRTRRQSDEAAATTTSDHESVGTTTGKSTDASLADNAAPSELTLTGETAEAGDVSMGSSPADTPKPKPTLRIDTSSTRFDFSIGQLEKTKASTSTAGTGHSASNRLSVKQRPTPASPASAPSSMRYGRAGSVLGARRAQPRRGSAQLPFVPLSQTFAAPGAQDTAHGDKNGTIDTEMDRDRPEALSNGHDGTAHSAASKDSTMANLADDSGPCVNGEQSSTDQQEGRSNLDLKTALSARGADTIAASDGARDEGARDTQPGPAALMTVSAPETTTDAPDMVTAENNQDDTPDQARHQRNDNELQEVTAGPTNQERTAETTHTEDGLDSQMTDVHQPSSPRKRERHDRLGMATGREAKAKSPRRTSNTAATERSSAAETERKADSDDFLSDSEQPVIPQLRSRTSGARAAVQSAVTEFFKPSPLQSTNPLSHATMVETSSLAAQSHDDPESQDDAQVDSSLDEDATVARPSQAPGPIDTVERWRATLGARLVDNLADGRCLFQAVDGTLRGKLPGNTIGRGKTATKEAYDLKQICCTYLLYYLPQMIANATIHVSELHARYFGLRDTSLTLAEKHEDIVLHIWQKYEFPPNASLPKEHWSGAEEIFGLVWYLREPIFVIGEDAYVQMYSIDQAADKDTSDERICIHLPTREEAWAILRTFINHEVVPRVLVHTGGASAGHFRSLRFPDSWHTEWPEPRRTTSGLETMRDRRNQALIKLGYYAAWSKPPLPLATKDDLHPLDLSASGSMYSPSSQEQSQDESTPLRSLTPAELTQLHEQLNPHQRLRSAERQLWRMAEQANLAATRSPTAPGHTDADDAPAVAAIVGALERRIFDTKITMAYIQALPYPLVAIVGWPTKLVSRVGKELIMTGRQALFAAWSKELPQDQADALTEITVMQGGTTDARWTNAQDFTRWKAMKALLGREVQQHRTLPASESDQVHKLMVALVACMPADVPLDTRCLRAHHWISTATADARQLLAEIRCHKWTTVAPTGVLLCASAHPLQITGEEAR